MIIEMIRGADFHGLRRYLVEGREHKIIDVRGVSTAESSAAEMTATARLNSYVQKAVLHLIAAPAAADQDGMSDELWNELFGQVEQELGLSERQRLIVEHPGGDGLKKLRIGRSSDERPHRGSGRRHWHAMYNIVHPFLGTVPQDRDPLWIAEHVGMGNLEWAKQRQVSWSWRLDLTASCIADRFAERHQMIRVPSLKSRATDANVKIPSASLKREERTGIRPLAELGRELQAALKQPTWRQRIEALALLGVRIKPHHDRKADSTTDGRIVGIALVDDRLNRRIKASALGREFGFEVLEQGRSPGTEALSEILTQQDASPSIAQASQLAVDDVVGRQLYLDEFARVCREHDKRRKANSKKRQEVLNKQAEKRRELSEELAHERSKTLKRTPRAFHANARKLFKSLVAEPRRAELQAKQKSELEQLRTGVKPRWREWLAEQANGGDDLAATILSEMETRHARHGYRPKPHPVQQTQPRGQAPAVRKKARYGATTEQEAQIGRHEMSENLDVIYGIGDAAAAEVDHTVGTEEEGPSVVDQAIARGWNQRTGIGG